MKISIKVAEEEWYPVARVSFDKESNSRLKIEADIVVRYMHAYDEFTRERKSFDKAWGKAMRNLRGKK